MPLLLTSHYVGALCEMRAWVCNNDRIREHCPTANLPPGTSTYLYKVNGKGKNAVFVDYIFKYNSLSLRSAKIAGISEMWRISDPSKSTRNDNLVMFPREGHIWSSVTNSFSTRGKCVSLHMWIIHQWTLRVHQLCMQRKQFQSHALHAY